ncbi:MAG TPA: sigma-E factor negative regulatory protein [Pseudomonadales bacterium]
MTEQLRQSLSAAIDDEADAFELRRVMDELGRDPELRAVWDRYHLIGDVLRADRRTWPRGTHDPLGLELRERVWQALDGGASADDADPIPEAEPVPVATAAAGPRRSSLGRYTGLAVAASAAFAVVLGFGGFWSDDSADSPAATGLVASDAAGVMSGNPVPALPETAGAPLRLATEVSPKDVQRAQAYILHHTQQQALNQNGVMSFVKLATYEAP